MHRVANLQFLAAEWPAISRRLDEALSLASGRARPWIGSLAETDSIKTKLRQLLVDAAAVETGDFLGTLPKLSARSGKAGKAAARRRRGRHDRSVPTARATRPRRHGNRLARGASRRTAAPQGRAEAPALGWAPGFAARLARERDILASLEHPNIARLYDAGVDALGRPYLALELVDGTPIDRYCSEHG